MGKQNPISKQFITLESTLKLHYHIVRFGCQFIPMNAWQCFNASLRDLALNLILILLSRIRITLNIISARSILGGPVFWPAYATCLKNSWVANLRLNLCYQCNNYLIITNNLCADCKDTQSTLPVKKPNEAATLRPIREY